MGTLEFYWVKFKNFTQSDVLEFYWVKNFRMYWADNLVFTRYKSHQLITHNIEFTKYNIKTYLSTVNQDDNCTDYDAISNQQSIQSLHKKLK